MKSFRDFKMGRKGRVRQKPLSGTQLDLFDDFITRSFYASQEAQDESKRFEEVIFENGSICSSIEYS